MADGTKAETILRRSSSSATESPDPVLGAADLDVDHDHDADADADADAAPQQLQQRQQQKRKGGRKPIYATSEERKQRNRQAQAAFRERRTEYIKQLESTIKLHEQSLHNLQQTHRTATDECLMLRYKNSLLERILLEKGIDVQAELRIHTTSPTQDATRPGPPPATSPNQPPMPRAIRNRRHHQRFSMGAPRKVDSGPGVAPILPDAGLSTRSPLSQATPGSHLSSPSMVPGSSPNFVSHASTSMSPNFAPLSHQQPPLRPQPPRSQFPPIMIPQQSSLVPPQGMPTVQLNASASGGRGRSSSASLGPSTYYAPPFQSHMNQLDQEYDAQADLMDDQEPGDHSAGQGLLLHGFPPHPSPIQMRNMQPPVGPVQNPPYTAPAALQPSEPGVIGAALNLSGNPFDAVDPMLDADPFGLSESMRFSTQFPFSTR